jgi:hypothetical protein
MNEKQPESKSPRSMLEAWMESATQYWNSMTKMWEAEAEKALTTEIPKKDDKGRVQESMESALKMWRTLSSVMADPGFLESLSHGINTVPEIFMKMTQTGWGGFFQLQQQWMEKATTLGKRTEAYRFENLDQEAVSAWTEIYKEELSKFLKVPQLGLTRFYQERVSNVLDKFNLYQGAMAEFMFLLYLPMEKSFKVMQEKLEKDAKEGDLPVSPQEYYRMWIKILEGHFMTLFKSPEYTQAMSKALDAMEKFTMARQEWLNDILQAFPVATNKDMDEVYKELYQLKKKINHLEKRVNRSD